jgi:amino acid permease
LIVVCAFASPLTLFCYLTFKKSSKQGDEGWHQRGWQILPPQAR